MTSKFRFGIFGLLVCLFSSCADDELPDPCGEDGALCRYTDGVMIINEGQFLTGNASISFYDPVRQTVENDIFQTVNGTSLGDIAQSMTLTDNGAYIVVNNSQKIEAVENGTMRTTATITGFSSPRYLLPITDSKAYVSDIAGKFFVVDLTTQSISKELAMAGWTENMVLVNNEVYVVHRTSYLVGTEVAAIAVIDAMTDAVTTQIPVRANPSSIAVDNEKNLWVLCGGDSLESSALMMINPILKKVVKTINIEDKTFFGGPSALKAGPDGGELYYLNNGLYRISITASSEPAAPFIAPANFSIYDFDIDPATGDIYCADPIDFVQQGMVYRFDDNANLVDAFNAGIVPGDFAFN